MYKFQVGQKVIFHQGPAAKEVNAPETIEVTIYQRDNENGHLIYQVEWEPTGKASVSENELRRMPDPPIPPPPERRNELIIFSR